MVALLVIPPEFLVKAGGEGSGGAVGGGETQRYRYRARHFSGVACVGSGR